MPKITKPPRDERIFDMWLSCHTGAEILARNGDFRFPPKVGDLSDIENDKDRFDALEEANSANAAHDADFKVPLYNIWKQQDKSNANGHFGNSEVRWVDNLLYLYTEPFDIVVDPFGGADCLHSSSRRPSKQTRPRRMPLSSSPLR